MIKQKRYERILGIVQAQHAVSIDEFCEQLDVSKATIRRDLIYMDSQRLLKRTHGGAVSLVKPAATDIPIAMRHSRNKEDKERVAQQAATYIEDGMTIYVGTGSTMLELAEQLKGFSNLTVITNDIGVAGAVSATQNRLLVPGGMLKAATSTLAGAFTEGMLRDLHVDIAFMSADAVCNDGFMDFSMDEVAIKRQVLQNARKSIMLVDKSKFGGDAFMVICPLKAIDLTIASQPIVQVDVQQLMDNGLRLQTA